jgi:hypothetical protein
VTRGRRGWAPALTGRAARQALDAVRALADALADPWSENEPPAAPDLAMRAVFFSACADAVPTSGHAATAESMLEAAVARANQQALFPALHGGLLTVAWATRRLAEPGENANREIDAALAVELASRPWRGSYDLVGGLVGLGVYALERPQLPSSRALLSLSLAQLEARSRAVSGGLAWHTPPSGLPPAQRALSPAGHYNIGVAHGAAGVLGLAARALAAGVEVERAERLVRGGGAWIASIGSTGADDARYPSWIAGGADCDRLEPPRTPSRSAWCYGDPGVAVQLWAAGRSAGEPSWCREALSLVHRALRRPARRARILDAGLCHGAVGFAHILNRLGQAAGDRVLRDGATDWYRRSLAMRRPGAGCTGYLTHVPDRRPPWAADRSFLTGACGIGLALLAACSEAPPHWDRCLLLDVS